MKHKNTGQRSLKIAQKFFPKVTSVSDATKDLHVEVTAKDDKNSRLKNHAECALAVACKRKESADGVIISVRSAYVVKGNVATRYRVPEATTREVISFDRNGGFQPGTYRLRKPQGSEKLGSTHSREGRDNSSRSPARFRHQTENIRTSLLKE